MSTTILSSPTTAAAAPRREPFFRPEIDRLMMYDGKAEIIDGRIVIMSPAGAWHNFVSGEIFMSLHDYVRRVNKGRAITDNATLRVDLPHRESFSPDAAYHVGPLAKLGPYLAAPGFAAEVRSPGGKRTALGKTVRRQTRGLLCLWDASGVGCRPAIEHCRPGLSCYETE